MYWEWAKDSILDELTNKTPPKNIYRAVCAELGRYYQGKGFKYTKSGPTLSIQVNDIALEIGFKSSSYNRSGEYVYFEIIPTFYCIPYVKADVKGRGILLSHTDISSEYDMNKNDIQCVLIGIYGDVTTFANNAYPNEKVRYSHMCDIYKIDAEKFSRIISYIDNRIIPWVDKIQEAPGVAALIAVKRATRPDWNLQNCNDYINCSLAYYICDKFPILAKEFKIDPHLL